MLQTNQVMRAFGCSGHEIRQVTSYKYLGVGDLTVKSKVQIFGLHGQDGREYNGYAYTPHPAEKCLSS